MYLNPEAESKTRTRRENQGGEGGGGFVALKKSGTKTRPDAEDCRVALKKVALKTWAETGGDPLALKNFGTKTEGEEPGKRFGTQKNWHSISMVGTVQIRAGQFALKDFRTKGNRRAVGTGVFSLNFFLTQTAKTLN